VSIFEPVTAVRRLGGKSRVERGLGHETRAAPAAEWGDADPVAVRAVGITKTFLLPHERRTAVRDRALHLFAPAEYEVLEALKDVSFEVRRGEFFGIVGRNGSGKSTLMRCLAGIYAPDAGYASIEGRVAPFIELGVGFNPELAARENAIQSAVLFGLSPREAADRFDSMLAFAELERFVGHKLKNYSSGMSARLAFAVTIHVDADVLLFDEVLAVGDASFRHKCLEHFDRLRADGKTIVLVTHDTSTVKRHCENALLLDGGRVVESGPAEAVIDRYDELTAAAAEERARHERALAAAWTPPAPPPVPGTLRRLWRRAADATEVAGRAVHAIVSPLLTATGQLIAPSPGRASMLGPDRHRFLMLTRLLAKSEFRLKYEGTVLNYAWALARPAVLFGVLLLVFGHLGRFNHRVEHYPAYLLLATVVWTFYSQAASACVGSLRRRGTLLRKLPFPRLAVPLSTILTAAFDLAMNLAVAMVFVLATGVSPRLSWLEFPLLLAIVAAFATGIGCLVSVLYVRYRDLDQLWTITSQVLFYLTPVFYVATRVPESLQTPLLLLNPLASVFTEFRHALIDPAAPSAAQLVGGYPMLMIPLGIAFGMLALGLWVFARKSPRAAEFV
jgi:ABC-type polysaccharide/polyol phosphate transport system ATPase subunit/ABC-type polysaccharide/polyol phosphate export permease